MLLIQRIAHTSSIEHTAFAVELAEANYRFIGHNGKLLPSLDKVVAAQMKLLGVSTSPNGAGGVIVRQGLRISPIVIDIIIITRKLSSSIINTYIHTPLISLFTLYYTLQQPQTPHDILTRHATNSKKHSFF